MSRNSKFIHLFYAGVICALLSPAVAFADAGMVDAATAVPVEKATETHAVIQAGSMLGIDVFKEKDLSGQYRVGETGKIIFPLVGEIQAANMTIEEFRLALVESLKKFIKDPMVSVDLVREKLNGDTSGDVVLVLGQVKNQGAQNITSTGSSLLKAIAQAGGFSAIANPRSVKVVSNHDGARKAVVFNLYDVLEARIDDPVLYPGDVVYVGESTF